MSAFIVDNAHIDAMLTAALAWSDGGRFTFYQRTADGVTPFVLTDDTADHVGALLLVENQRSVNMRYDEDDIEPIYVFKALPWQFGKKPDPVTVLKIVRCYEYQSCEHDGWRDSPGFGFCQFLTALMIANLPGYEKAPGWGIGESQRNIFTR